MVVSRHNDDMCIYTASPREITVFKALEGNAEETLVLSSLPPAGKYIITVVHRRQIQCVEHD
jgi:hypothetical protein